MMNLSQVATRVRQIRFDANEMASDPFASEYGVSGLAADAAGRSERAALRDLFASCGWTVEQYSSELETRVSGKFIYNNCLLVDAEDLVEPVRYGRAW